MKAKSKIQSSRILPGCFQLAPCGAEGMIQPQELSFVSSAASRRAVIAELLENGIERWTDVAGRQIPASVVARHSGCGERTLKAFVRLVRENDGCVTVDTPAEWKPYSSKITEIIKSLRIGR